MSHLYASGVCVLEKRFITWCIMYDCGKPLPLVCVDYSSVRGMYVCERAENSTPGKRRKVRGAGRNATGRARDDRNKVNKRHVGEGVRVACGGLQRNGDGQLYTHTHTHTYKYI